MRRCPPDVALVDLFLGGGVRSGALREIRVLSPTTRVLLISGAGSISAAVARAAGPRDSSPRTWPPRDVINAVRMVAIGLEVFAASQAPPPALSDP